MTVLIGIYNPPELYPPTLWAIQELEKLSDKIIIVTRNIKVEPWNFSAKVVVHRIGKKVELNAPASTPRKISNFLQFCKEMFRLVKKEKPAIWLAYDSIPLLAFYILRRFSACQSRIFWYHNHDVSELKQVRKFSVGWLAARFENKAIQKTNLFTLPSMDRLKFFKLEDYQGKIIILPNYPSKKFLESFKTNNDEDGSIKLIYQGSISPGHCLEEVIGVLNRRINNKTLQLTLIGWISPSYKENLSRIASRNGVEKQVHFREPVPYNQLFSITASHHIGLAVHKPQNIIYSTGGTASNKIYEYAAMGLPVILYDNDHFRKYCGGYKWATFIDGSSESIRNAIEQIMTNYSVYTKEAKNDFLNALNFEIGFEPVLKTGIA